MERSVTGSRAPLLDSRICTIGYFVNEAEDILAQFQKRFPLTAPSPIPIELVAHHIAASLLALMEWWLAKRQPYSRQQMGEFYTKLIIRAAYAALSVRNRL